MGNLLNIFEGLNEGDKVTLSIESYFGEIVEVKATYMGKIKQHGYLGDDYGSWGLYQNKYNNIPCYKVLVREYRQHNSCWINLYMDIKAVKMGW